MNTKNVNFNMTPIIDLMDSALLKITLLTKKEKPVDLEKASETYKDLLDEEHTIREELYNIQNSNYYTNFATERERAQDIDKALDMLNEIKRDKIKALRIVAESSLSEMQKLQLS